MMKRIAALLLVVLMCLGCIGVAWAHNQHDRCLEDILFGKHYTTKERNQKQLLIYLENASYLCVDLQDNKANDRPKTDKQYDSLRNYAVYGFPATLEEILCPIVPNHRVYTHLGWNKPYAGSEDMWSNSAWQKRRKLLLATVEKTFNFTPLIPDWIEYHTGYSKKCASFSALIYYIHLLWDHNEFESCSQYNTNFNRNEPYLLGLADSDAYSKDVCSEAAVIPALIHHMDILFNKKTNHTYSLMRSDLINLNSRASSHSYPVKKKLETEEDLQDYRDYAKAALEILMRYLPSLLQEEPFFNAVFPS